MLIEHNKIENLSSRKQISRLFTNVTEESGSGLSRNKEHGLSKFKGRGLESSRGYLNLSLTRVVYASLVWQCSGAIHLQLIDRVGRQPGNSGIRVRCLATRPRC